MAGRCGAIIDPAVAHIDDKSGFIKLGLCKSDTGQPRQVTGPRRDIASEVAGNNLVLPLIQLPWFPVRLNRNHVRLSGEGWQILGTKADEQIHIMQPVILAADRFQFESIDQGQCGGVGIGVFYKLDREHIRGDLSGIALGIDKPGRRVDFVVVEIVAVPLDGSRRTGQALQFGQRLRVPVDEIGVLGDVSDDLGPGLFQRVAPLGFDRANELDEMHPLAAKRRNHRARCLNSRRRCIDARGIEANQIAVIPNLHGARLHKPGAHLIDLIELVTPVVCEESATVVRNLLRRRGIPDLDLVGHGGIGSGEQANQSQDHREKKCNSHSPALWRTR